MSDGCTWKTNVKWIICIDYMRRVQLYLLWCADIVFRKTRNYGGATWRLHVTIFIFIVTNNKWLKKRFKSAFHFYLDIVTAWTRGRQRECSQWYPQRRRSVQRPRARKMLEGRFIGFQVHSLLVWKQNLDRADPYFGQKWTYMIIYSFQIAIYRYKLRLLACWSLNIYRRYQWENIAVTVL